MTLVFSLLPIAVLILALTALRLPAWCAALAALAAGVVEAFFVFGLSLGDIAGSSAGGVAEEPAISPVPRQAAWPQVFIR